jgi:hypothetical protein
VLRLGGEVRRVEPPEVLSTARGLARRLIAQHS